MSRCKVLAGALLLSMCSLATATTVLNVTGSLDGLIDVKTYSFDVETNGLYDVNFSLKGSSLASAAFGVYDKIGSSWMLVGGSVGSGSFSFSGGAGVQYKAVVGDVNLAANSLPFSLSIASAGGGVPAPVPEPETWAIMALGIGLVVYQVRPRQSRASLNVLG